MRDKNDSIMSNTDLFNVSPKSLDHDEEFEPKVNRCIPVNVD